MVKNIFFDIQGKKLKKMTTKIFNFQQKLKKNNNENF